eukprot:CAMPEP_0174277128 /NCGR_PEP_ID=MMETSP0439-20130205/60761_1 /TAXON_ID=0 /ORGANISM="Stereomyxa ramosa, Strain Chinc5" /LENGTH=210 /DNA_ID=CAMNT_0015369413 /DNA_START=1170 /DNA_END=1802 /DNA_ORIENTATION=-
MLKDSLNSLNIGARQEALDQKLQELHALRGDFFQQEPVEEEIQHSPVFGTKEIMNEIIEKMVAEGCARVEEVDMLEKLGPIEQTEAEVEVLQSKVGRAHCKELLKLFNHHFIEIHEKGDCEWLHNEVEPVEEDGLLRVSSSEFVDHLYWCDDMETDNCCVDMWEGLANYVNQHNFNTILIPGDFCSSDINLLIYVAQQLGKQYVVLETIF